jgi:putative flippase GtrA
MFQCRFVHILKGRKDLDRTLKSKDVIKAEAAQGVESSKPSSWPFIPRKFQEIFHKYQILNFMFVGGIGYAVNMATYYPLTIVFKNEVNFLGQQFYLPPFVISSLIAILCNYELNRIWTFKGWSENSFGGARYFTMALATLFIDMAFLYLLVQYGKLHPLPAAALAILIVFIIRYTIARKWVWSK